MNFKGNCIKKFNLFVKIKKAREYVQHSNAHNNKNTSSFLPDMRGLCQLHVYLCIIYILHHNNICSPCKYYCCVYSKS